MPQMANTPAWARMEVINAVELGKYLVGLVQNADKDGRPKTVGDLIEKVGDSVNFYNVTPTDEVQFIDTPTDKIVIRLPPLQLINAAERQFRDADFKLSMYPKPKYISDILSQSITPEYLFYARIGDYSTSECA